MDDAIWLTDQLNESSIQRMVRSRSKVSLICRWSHKISCGNEYLSEYALQFNKNVIVNPTTIDTELLHNPQHYSIDKVKSRVVIGWTGSHSTLKYLYQLEDILQQIQMEHDHVDLLVIANKPPQIKLERVIFRNWSKQTEITDLLESDIGIMPLPNDAWTRGKCGFKALQYMALEIPPIASAVGVNKKILQHGKNGFLCETNNEWSNVLKELIRDESLRKAIGSSARKTVISHYSVLSNSSNFLSLFGAT